MLLIVKFINGWMDISAVCTMMYLLRGLLGCFDTVGNELVSLPVFKKSEIRLCADVH